MRSGTDLKMNETVHWPKIIERAKLYYLGTDHDAYFSNEAHNRQSSWVWGLICCMEYCHAIIFWFVQGALYMLRVIPSARIERFTSVLQRLLVTSHRSRLTYYLACPFTARIRLDCVKRLYSSGRLRRSNFVFLQCITIPPKTSQTPRVLLSKFPHWPRHAPAFGNPRV